MKADIGKIDSSNDKALVKLATLIIVSDERVNRAIILALLAIGAAIISVELQKYFSNNIEYQLDRNLILIGALFISLGILLWAWLRKHPQKSDNSIFAGNFNEYCKLCSDLVESTRGRVSTIQTPSTVSTDEAPAYKDYLTRTIRHISNLDEYNRLVLIDCENVIDEIKKLLPFFLTLREEYKDRNLEYIHGKTKHVLNNTTVRISFYPIDLAIKKLLTEVDFIFTNEHSYAIAFHNYDENSTNSSWEASIHFSKLEDSTTVETFLVKLFKKIFDESPPAQRSKFSIDDSFFIVKGDNEATFKTPLKYYKNVTKLLIDSIVLMGRSSPKKIINATMTEFNILGKLKQAAMYDNMFMEAILEIESEAGNFSNNDGTPKLTSIVNDIIKERRIEITKIFSYASNMNIRHLKDYLREKGFDNRDSLVFQKACLKDHEIVWNYKLKNKLGGVANIRRKEGEVLYGVVMELKFSDKKKDEEIESIKNSLIQALDDKEGPPNASYYLNKVGVNLYNCNDNAKTWNSDTCDAWVYWAEPNKNGEENIWPAKDYLDLIVEAAKDFEFPPNYVDKLNNTPVAKSIPS